MEVDRVIYKTIDFNISFAKSVSAILKARFLFSKTLKKNKVPKSNTAQKMKFVIKDFFSKCDQTRRKLRIWSHLLRKSLMENLIFCAQSSYFQNILSFAPQQKVCAHLCELFF